MANGDRAQHWQGVYSSRASDTVSWFQAAAEPSLRMIERLGVLPPARIIDVGGGASRLVDALAGRGFQVTVLDIAASALAVARRRLGADAKRVEWEVADITRWRPRASFDVWHDRAVFHFLTEPADREAYLSALGEGLAPDGAVILATFAPDGPERCSGLPVRRYGVEALAAELGPGFSLVDQMREIHVTPTGAAQPFTWTAFRRQPLPASRNMPRRPAP